VKVGFNCIKCGKVSQFETKDATHVFEEEHKEPIFKVYCVYCGFLNNTLYQAPEKQSKTKEDK
jgi:Zn ribbon nucleic-acid-binding protein